MAGKLLERDIQRTIIAWLKMRRVFFWRNNTGAINIRENQHSRFVRFGMRGAPDIFAVAGGRIFGIEVKSATGRQSEWQKAYQRDFEQAGGRYILARCLEDVMEITR